MIVLPELTYTAATVSLPGTLSLAKPDKPYGAGCSVRFVRNDFYVSAYVSSVIWDKPNLKQEFIQPLVDLVTADLATIDDLLPRLQELHRAGHAPSDLMYSKEGTDWKIYDNFSTPPGPIMDILSKIKNTDVRLLKSEYIDLIPMAANVNQVQGHLVHVEGGSLREALERAISIYDQVERLREIRAS